MPWSMTGHPLRKKLCPEMKKEKNAGFSYSKNMANGEALSYVISPNINLLFLKSALMSTMFKVFALNLSKLA